MGFWTDVIQPALNGIVSDVIGILPALAGAIAILVIGYIIARVIGGLIHKLLSRVGFNSVAERAGITDFLKRSGFKREVSWVVGRMAFWTIMLTFLLSSAEALNLTALAQTLQQAVAYIPNLIVIILVLVFGSLLSRLAGQLVKGSAESAGIEFADFLGKLVGNFILIGVFVIAISQLDIKSAVLDYIFIALLAAVGLAVALTLGLGAREIAQAIIYGVYARKLYEPGQEITVGEQTGELLRIGTLNAVLQTARGMLTVPNRLLMETFVTVKDALGSDT